MNLLHLDSSILGGNSVSRALSAAVVDHIRHGHQDLQVTYRDLASESIPHLSAAYLAAAQSPAGEHAPEIAHDLALGGEVLEEFLAADVVVIGTAFYNFSVPSQLKAWIDRICVAGKTFRYTEKGPEGLAGDKRVIMAIARGGFYGEGSPIHSFEHAESYLRTVLGFMGVFNPEVVAAEGVSVGPEQREAAVKAAMAQIAAIPIAA